MPPTVDSLTSRMEWAAAQGLSELTLILDGCRVTIRREAATPTIEPAAAPETPREEADSAAPQGTIVAAPLAGLCHLSPEAGGAPFVAPGASVEAGRTLCVIEAMKVMTAVTAPMDGSVDAVLVEDGASVEAGAPLVRLRGWGSSRTMLS